MTLQTSHTIHHSQTVHMALQAWNNGTFKMDASHAAVKPVGPARPAKAVAPKQESWAATAAAPNAKKGSAAALLLPPFVNLLRSLQHRLMPHSLNDPYKLLSPLLAKLALAPAMPFHLSRHCHVMCHLSNGLLHAMLTMQLLQLRWR